MRRIAGLALALAACGDNVTPAPAALLDDLAPGPAGASPRFVAAGDDIYLRLGDGDLYVRRGGGALAPMGSIGARTLVAANASGVFTADDSNQLGFCDASHCRDLATVTGRGYVAGDRLYVPGRLDATPCLVDSDGVTAGCAINDFVVARAVGFGAGALFTGAPDGGVSGVYAWDGVADPVLLAPDSAMAFVMPAVSGATGWFLTDDGAATHVWQTDGTLTGTTDMGELPSLGAIGPTTLVATTSVAYVASGSVWRIDDGGATMLPGTAVSAIAGFGSTVAYLDGTEVRRGDGSSAGTVAGVDLVGAGAFAIIAGADALWKLGPSGDAVALTGDYGAIEAGSLAAAGDRAYLSAGDADRGAQPWGFDPAVAPDLVTLLGELGPPRSSSPQGFARAGDVAYFATAADLPGVWRSDGTVAGTTSVLDHPATIDASSDGTAWAFDGTSAWWIDRTGAATQIATGVTALVGWGPSALALLGQSPALLTSDGGVVGVTSPPGVHIGPMRATPGAVFACTDVGALRLDAGKHALVAIAGAPACTALFAAGAHVLAGSADGVWAIDGTAHRLLRGSVDAALGGDSTAYVFAGKLWRTDGVTATSLGGTWVTPVPLGQIGGRLVFDAATVAGGPRHLYNSDLDDLGGGGGVLCSVALDDRVWVWLGSARQRWQSDGTRGGTFTPGDLPGFDPAHCAIARFAERVLYDGHAADTGDELWSAPVF